MPRAPPPGYQESTEEDPWYVPHNEGQPASLPSVSAPVARYSASSSSEVQVVPYDPDRFATAVEAQREELLVPKSWKQRPIAPWAQPEAPALAAPVTNQAFAPHATSPVVGPLATTPLSAPAPSVSRRYPLGPYAKWSSSMSGSSISEGSFVRVGEESAPVQAVAEETSFDALPEYPSPNLVAEPPPDWNPPDEPDEPQRPPSPSTTLIIDTEFEVVGSGTVPTEDDAQSISSIGPSISLVNAPLAQPAAEPAAEPATVPAAEPVAMPVAEEQQQQPVPTPDVEEPLPISVAESPPRAPVRLRSAGRPAARSRSQRQLSLIHI